MSLHTPIIRSDGVTEAERFLKRLGDRSFLSMWSYAGVYRDQGRKNNKGDGKEVGDLLVVFENHIIIFSDKDCEFPSTGNTELDWQRWYRKAVLDPARQIFGAERWIRSYPDRLYLDRSCTIRFPIDLPSPDIARFHRIVVAHASTSRCIEEFGGSGSLMLDSTIIGDKHYAPISEGGKPFAIGQIDPAKGYVHVFDDTTLSIIMTYLDTVTDFVNYLTKKEEYILSGKSLLAAGEEDLLAFYLKDMNSDEEHDFVIPQDINCLVVGEGFWEEFRNSPQRKAQFEANRISYAWDALIENFTHHIFAGTSHFLSHPSINEQERIFRFLAREPRTRRRMLAKGLLDFIRRTPKQLKASRTIFPSDEGDPYYVFMLLPYSEGDDYERYREVRREMLASHCMMTRLNFPEAKDIVGIATETARGEEGSEDFVYFDGSVWTDEDKKEAQRVQEELNKAGLIGKKHWHKTVEKEYPDVAPSLYQQNKSNIKGRDRNKSCPCGSGKKAKKCCG